MSKTKINKIHQLIEKENAYVAKCARIPYYDLVIKKAKGSVLTDIEGKKYIDLISAASTTNVGHSHKKIVAAIQKQSESLIHYPPAYAYHKKLLPLSKKLIEITPGNFPKKVAFGLSGSDANDGIIKMARSYTKRPYVIAFDNAYHGSTYGAISLSGILSSTPEPFKPLVSNIYHIPYPDVFHSKSQDPEQVTKECLDALKNLFATTIRPEEVACILVEPIAGDAGIIVPPTRYIQELYAICKKYNICFAVDEIQQGMGRTGKWWSIEHFDIEPDIISIAKSLGSGLPISAIVARSEIMDSLNGPAHIFSTGGNPVCCEAALATIKVIEEEKLITRSQTEGDYAKNRFMEMQKEFPFIGDVRGIGLNLGIEIVKKTNPKISDQVGSLKIVFRAFEKGVAIITLAKSTLRFQPPLNISRKKLDKALDILYLTFKEFDEDKIPDSIVNEGSGW